MENNRNRSTGRIPSSRKPLKPQNGSQIRKKNSSVNLPPAHLPKSPNSPSKEFRSSSFQRPPSAYGGNNNSILKSDSFSSQNSGSRGSNGSKNSVLTPRTLPMTFKDISSRFLPSALENSPGSKPRIALSNPFKHTTDEEVYGGVGDDGGGGRHKQEDAEDDFISMSGSDSENSLLSNHSSQESHESLRMDRIHGDFAPMSTNISMNLVGVHRAHARSKSEDFGMLNRPRLSAEIFGQDHPIHHRKVLLHESSPADAILKTPAQPQFRHAPSYGATNNISNKMKKYYEEYDDMEISPFIKNGGNIYSEPARTYVSHLGNSFSDDAEKLPPPAKRSLRHRIYLILADPQSSILSAIFYFSIMFLILLSNLVIMLKTMDYFQHTPQNCIFCDRYEAYYESINSEDCTCPPETVDWLENFERYIMFIFACEWLLRIFCYDPPPKEGKEHNNCVSNFFEHLLETTTILDFLATFPYFADQYNVVHGSNSLAFLRLFRVFQMVRLGYHDSTFCAIVNVLAASFEKLMLLFVFLFFGGAIFGFLIYWCERGEWRYTDLVDPPGWAWVRPSPDGQTEELSPFRSIPGALYWFIVTATTVGYGDVYPTTPAGKVVAGITMLLGVLLIAFPVSIFSDMWQKELKHLGAYESLANTSEVDDNINFRGSKMEKIRPPKVISTPTNAMLHTNRLDESDHSLMFFKNSQMSSGDSVPLDDIQAIRHYMKVINEAQHKMNEILERMEESDRGLLAPTQTGSCRRFESERPPTGRR